MKEEKQKTGAARRKWENIEVGLYDRQIDKMPTIHFFPMKI